MEPSSSSSKNYKGVRMRSWGKWVCEIREPNKRSRIWLGSYSTAEAAARAYDFALVCLRGPNVLLNFPDSPPDVPSSDTGSLSPKRIQSLAAAYAAQFEHDHTSRPSSPGAAAHEEEEEGEAEEEEEDGGAAADEDPSGQPDESNQQREDLLESLYKDHDQDLECDVEVCRDIASSSQCPDDDLDDWPSFDYTAPGSSNNDSLWFF